MTTIIDIDKSANQKLKQAIERKEQEMQRINSQKNALSKQIREYADDHLKSFEESEKLAAQDSILAIKNSADSEINRLQTIFDQNCNVWTDSLVKRILK